MFEDINNNEFDGQWVTAENLKVCHKLLLSNGKNSIISKVETEELDKPITTYNFEVVDYHTYYVEAEEILVHNPCGWDFIDYIANSTDDAIIMDIQGSGKNGIYNIQFKSGNRYIGKGGEGRMCISAPEKASLYDDAVVAVKLRQAISNRAALI